MKRAVFLALFLAGCQTTEDRMAADDAKCLSYGTKKGDPAYVQCRMNLDNNRAAVTAYRDFGSGRGLISRLGKED